MPKTIIRPLASRLHAPTVLWLADGLTLWRRAQLATDTTLVSPLHSDGTAIRRAAAHDGGALEAGPTRRSGSCAFFMQCRGRSCWAQTLVPARAFSMSLLEQRPAVGTGAVPSVQEVLRDDRFGESGLCLLISGEDFISTSILFSLLTTKLRGFHLESTLSRGAFTEAKNCVEIGFSVTRIRTTWKDWTGRPCLRLWGHNLVLEAQQAPHQILASALSASVLGVS